MEDNKAICQIKICKDNKAICQIKICKDNKVIWADNKMCKDHKVIWADIKWVNKIKCLDINKWIRSNKKPNKQHNKPGR